MKTIPARFGNRRPHFTHRTRGILVSTACALMVVSALADTKLVTDGTPVRILVPTDGNLGGTWRGLSFNDSAWLAGTNGVGYEVTPGAYNATVIADSRAEWSSRGVQGENQWLNGYYNKTGDADATYQAADFQPFPRAEGPWDEDNFWDGGSWNWAPDPMPWDTIGATSVHPNGENSGGVEHWVIRRWRSTVAGAVTIRFHLRKDNPSGTGVSGKVLKNGAELFSRAIAGSDTVGYEVYVHTTAAVGDIFDFANTPVGLGGDASDGSDGSVMTATILSGTVTPPAPPVEPTSVADSSADWVENNQGANGWFYGYYNRTADADGVYDPNTDFNSTDPNWTFQGGSWQLGEAGNPGANPPWDTIGQTDWHPNGDNQPQGAHWVIRRWVSDVDGDLHARVQFRKANLGGGNGTTLHVLLNGADVYSKTVAFNDGVGVDTFVSLPGVLIGDKIEFALDPLGTDGLLGDGADGSFLTATIRTGPPPQNSRVADSVADWVTGTQGENGWYYGFYNETADADQVYSPGSDFNNTDPNWTLLDGSWQLGEAGNPGANPPWDTIGKTDWHPNGDNQPQGVHWVIKRWVSDVDGDLHANVQFGKANTGGGNGATVRVFHNGNQLFAHTVAFNNGTGINTNVALPGVLIGDTVEFALDPLGTDGSKNDGADGSFIRAAIIEGLPPEPPRPFVPGVADCFRTDVEAAMRGINPSVFIRIPFDVADPALVETLKLKMKYNDGFVAYLNGTEIIKRNTPTSIAGITVADSIADWSTNPDVTVNGWSYGYYDQSLDADGSYSGSDLTLFPHDGGGHSATDFWNGTGWDWFQINPPWTELFQETTHPNHPNGGVVNPADPATHIHWTVRRWSATVDANLKCRVRFRKTNPNCGDGVRVDVFHNSVRVYSQTIAFNDSVGRDDTIDLPDVFIGDNIDVLLGPGEGTDYCDGSAFSVLLFEGEPSIPWDGAATATRTTTETISPEVFDISNFISELRAGANVLAIQGFNRTVNDNEFVINAELLANKVPTAVNDSVVAATDVPATYPASVLLANDSDSDGDSPFVVGVTSSYVTAQGGTVRLFGDSIHYTPPAGYSGPDSFQYTINDGGSRTASATVQVNVTGNTPPVAVDDSASTAEDVSVTINVLSNDTDADGDPLSVTATTSPARGVAVNNGDGTVTYTPAADFNGTDSFNYTVSDGNGGTDTGTVTVIVTPVSDPPVARQDDVTTAEDTPIVINVLANDTDADGDTLTVTAIGPVTHGTAVINPDSTITFTPEPDYWFTGVGLPADFTYTISDGHGGTSSSVVRITVTPVNDCPIANGQSVTARQDSAVNFTLTSTDVDGGAPQFSVTQAPLNGNLVVQLSGAATYTPNAGYLGSDSFRFRVFDGVCFSDEATVTINVVPANEPPVADASATKLQVISANNSNALVRLDGSRSSDPDGDTLTYVWLVEGVPIASGVVADVVLEVGDHSVTLMVDDGQTSDTDTIEIRVITAGEAVEELILQVNQGNYDRKSKRALIATLKSAAASFGRGNDNSGVNQLQAFQNKVRAQVGQSDPALAAEWIRAAQDIVDAVNGQ